MGAEIREATGVDALLVEGGGGVFDVLVDGRRVFSKKAVGRFPHPGEIRGLLPA